MNSETTVFLVDDDAAVRHALTVYLKSVNLKVESFDSAERFLDDVDAANRGVLILDQRMDGMSGLDLQTKLKARGFALPIVFITGHGDVATSVKAMKSGAVDFIEKPFRNSDLLASIRTALQREKAEHKTRVTRAGVNESFASLTQREREVMKYVVQGMSNKDLAAHLGVSNRTIEVHRSNVMKKMQADSLPDLVRMAAHLESMGA
ncbi:MAG: response regulator [Gammaproteobacteria bacterium]|nr:response regulator [Gammaproteobacteria bacterium]MDH3560851.1 response regulator [Gammaproteobacteria bacterium]